MALAVRVRAALDGPVGVAQRELFVSGSIGVAFGALGDDPASVLRNADTAMYRAKDRGRNCAALYDDEMRREARRLLRTEVELHRALERDELVVHYQPVANLMHDGVVGVEALVRWKHPTRGLVLPGEFVPVAEETGLVVPMGRHVLEQACAFAAAHPEIGYVAVNVSPRQLAQPDVVETVRAVLRTSGLEPSRLCLEVTEALLVQDAEAAATTLRALQQDGARIAIDDFGTGWASLTYLQRFPVDTIKLDRSFVSRVTDDTAAAAIVASLIQLAHSMGLTVTGEGVETTGQAEFLRANRCDAGQGFLFARALAPEDLLLALASSSSSFVPQPRSGLSA
jgi:EAL domain-containing protein (putative c-di-GMP-specific phosphodiesterase class I)